jgi:hypothetical protein
MYGMANGRDVPEAAGHERQLYCFKTIFVPSGTTRDISSISPIVTNVGHRPHSGQQGLHARHDNANM